MTREVKIEDLVVGDGKAAEKGALITTHYRGWLDTGSEFDSSHKKGRPFQTVLSKNKVIQGWFMGLQGMKVGGKRRMTIPPILGYGVKRGVAGVIPANATLYFEVELLKVTP